MTPHTCETLKSLNGTIRALADLFPAVFVAEYSLPHKPLKRGIDKDLVACGALTQESAGTSCASTYAA
jgi:sRNA-binding protein